MATTTFTFYTVSWQGQDGTSAPGLAVPLPDAGDGAVGTSTSFARQDHVHPLPLEELSVGDVYGETDIWLLGGTLNRAYARRQGDLVVFSFVITLSESLSANSIFFFTSEELAPPDNVQIDFLMADSSYNAKYGQIGRSEGIDSETGLPIINGHVLTISQIPAGTLRGQVCWMIEPEEED